MSGASANKIATKKFNKYVASYFRNLKLKALERKCPVMSAMATSRDADGGATGGGRRGTRNNKEHGDGAAFTVVFSIIV